MHVFSFFPTNQIVSAVFTWCSKEVSAITNVCYKSVRYIDVFLGVFDRDSTGSLKKCTLLPGVRYITCPLLTGLTVLHEDSNIDP